MDHDIAREFFALVVGQAKAAGLMSSEHFSVDGTLIEAWASLKSFKRKDESAEEKPPADNAKNPTVDFHGEKRGNETHASTTDPKARLARKGNGKESKLSCSPARADGEPQRADRRHVHHACARSRRGRGRVHDARAQ